MKYENLDYNHENILKVATDYMNTLAKEMNDNDYSLLVITEYRGIITGIGFVLSLFKSKENFNTVLNFLNNSPDSGSF